MLFLGVLFDDVVNEWLGYEQDDVSDALFALIAGKGKSFDRIAFLIDGFVDLLVRVEFGLRTLAGLATEPKSPYL